MALDIGIGDGSSFCPLQNERSLQLDEGYYWFLHPLYEDLARVTGQYIDLYGDASFSGKNLAALEQMLKRALRLIESQESTWNVCIGTELVPHQKVTYSPPHLKETLAAVEKARFLWLISQWEQVVTRAKELDRPVVCFGD
jgi:hypothetical protein